ncbi:MAG: hypothetical protein M3301_05290, partial [Chloroflexota bacterium]|nr:hypothetical protein [Chloroflexota bacterium]
MAVAVLLAVTTALGAPTAASSVPGDLDPTFDGGIAITHPGGDSPGGDAGLIGEVLVAPDGKVLVAGNAASVEVGGPSWAGVARYRPDGSLDGSFGRGGFAPELGAASALALQGDGKIVTAGQPFLVARLLADGTLDRSFAGTGYAAPGVGSGDGADVVIQPDGKIVVAGSV